MAFINTTVVPFAANRSSLSGPLALSLAESAFKAGRINSAMRYVDIAYAIFDAQQTEPSRVNALPSGG